MTYTFNISASPIYACSGKSPSLLAGLPASTTYARAIHTVRGYLLRIRMSSILVRPEINACHHSV